jgi:hypothetical protein
MSDLLVRISRICARELAASQPCRPDGEVVLQREIPEASGIAVFDTIGGSSIYSLRTGAFRWKTLSITDRYNGVKATLISPVNADKRPTFFRKHRT